MNFINSQYINAEMTHCTVQKDYLSMRENGINIRVMDGLLYKPPGFWISVNYGWEEWSGAEEFQQDRDVHCNVYIKPNLTFIKIESVEDANELVRFLIPDMQNRFPELNGYTGFGWSMRDDKPKREFPISDMLNMSRYMIEHHEKGISLTSNMVWKKALQSCHGIYYKNNWDLHMNTIFNTWDCDSLVLFDPSNVISIMKRDKIYETPKETKE